MGNARQCMHADARKLLWDARVAAERAARFTNGKTFADYQADDLLRSGVERQLTIVGEALNRLRQIGSATASALPQLPRVVGLRNILVHGYATADNRIVWGIVESSVGNLLDSLDALLAQA
jgi:uncharacterized protein with HEPN domain